jgi:hypothetical protein
MIQQNGGVLRLTAPRLQPAAGPRLRPAAKPSGQLTAVPRGQLAADGAPVFAGPVFADTGGVGSHASPGSTTNV